jgi:hypothetical protein
MRFSIARALVLAAMVAAATPRPAMTQTTPPQPAPTQTAPASSTTQAPAAQNQAPTGKVIFSRSTDENGQTQTEISPSAVPGAAQPSIANAPVADDAERQAETFTGYDMDVRLRVADRHMAVRALVTLRNDGKTPLAHLPLQISSSLNWERILVGGREVAFQMSTLNSDADHTGQLHEAAVTLATPLAPGATVQLDVTYSGTIAPSVQRLMAIGTPDELALHTDWDGIGVDFTGLRGFGNVAWYPVSSVPVILGDGARLFDEIGEHKLRMEGARFRLRLTDEYPPGQAPTVALIDGHSAQLTVTDGSNEEVAGVATASLDASTLGFEAPSLFVAIRKPVEAAHMRLWALPEDEAAVPGWVSAATTVMPFLEGWLGSRPDSQLVILDLPDREDAPFETGAMLATPIRDAAAAQLDSVMVHELTHALLRGSKSPPPAWLDEGVASFMGSLWLERQSGRTKALESLEVNRAALALAEPSSPGVSAGQPLGDAFSPIYYRTKAAYVFWMLRDVAGDAALESALHAYDPNVDLKTNGKRGEFEKLLEEASPGRDLSWFFADWIDADEGLPDLTIDSVFPSAAEAGNTLVAVSLSNAGYAAAEIPVTVRTADASVTRRVLVPARGKVVERILVLGQPTEVEANDGTVPETQASVHARKIGDDSSSQANPAQP